MINENKLIDRIQKLQKEADERYSELSAAQMQSNHLASSAESRALGMAIGESKAYLEVLVLIFQQVEEGFKHE